MIENPNTAPIGFRFRAANLGLTYSGKGEAKLFLAMFRWMTEEQPILLPPTLLLRIATAT